MTVYKLMATTAGDAAASLDIQEEGILEGIQFAVRALLNADAEGLEVEVSFSSTNGFASNDTRASVAGVTIIAGLLTSGALEASSNVFVPLGMIKVNAGERMYLHTAAVGAGAISRCSAWLYVNDGASGDRSGRIRRGSRP